MSPVLAFFLNKGSPIFFTLFGEGILVRTRSSTSLVNAKRLPKWLSVHSSCSTHSHGHASQNTDNFEIRSRCQSLLVTLSMIINI